MNLLNRSTAKLGLRAEVTCPHCWNKFAPHEIRWISAHPDLTGDEKVGEDAQLRFLPSRFNFSGQAIDMKGVACSDLACPNCHLKVPRALLEMKPLFFSILGAPGSGKSYYIASMVWALRKMLSQYFLLSFGDADPISNQVLNDYEEKLFLNPNPDELVALPKTEKEGDLYQGVSINERTVWFAKPFVFSIQPDSDHPYGNKSKLLAHTICLYDNAGEHFLPGGVSANSPGTQHLSHSQALFFLFDPTQHSQIRQRCTIESSDPQMGEHGWSNRQDQVLFEAASRIRTQAGLPQNEKYKRPLIVVVTKYDAWKFLLGDQELNATQVIRQSRQGIHMIDLDQIKNISNQVRSVIFEDAPEFVNAAESFSEDVTYIPVSSLGHAPEVSETGGLAVRPSLIRPCWTEIPFLYALHKVVPKLIPAAKSKSSPGKQQNKSGNTSKPQIQKESGA